jgi:hypothetical protein
MDELPRLPAELLSQIFLEVDPHTLYTSIRCLSREWRKQVEENLLKSEFVTSRWRVGLRVTRKPKNGKAWRGGIAGQEGELAPGAEWIRIRREVEEAHHDATEEEKSEAMQRARDAYTHRVISRQGAREDELPDYLQEDSSSSLTHVLPLQFKAYNGESAMLQFGTASADWYAMFESEVEEAGEGSSTSNNSSRLDLDFSIVWRFPGDGQDGSDGDGWGVPDQENGWLSRFYCSNFDTSDAALQEDSTVLHTTPLARRVRKRKLTLQPESCHPDLNPSDSTLEWSDEGHEYMSLCLSLGTEFFVRRSAQANFLMRRLETEAEAGEDRRRRRIGGSSSSVSSTAPTPRRDLAASSSSSLRMSLTDPITRRLQDKLTVTACSSGLNTPNKSSGSEGMPSRRSEKATYASVASTPASGCSSPRGALLPMRLKGLPRIAKIQRKVVHNGSLAPFPSASTSGYSSVKHQSRVQDKYASSSAYTSLPSSPRHNAAGSSSSHGSIPRACFSAHLLASPAVSPLQWTSTTPVGGPSSRTAIHTSSSPLTLWEWSR